ncbi:hypothetical protein CRYUN_Cryun01aG0095300 [Craigia yunnanensis]
MPTILRHPNPTVRQKSLYIVSMSNNSLKVLYLSSYRLGSNLFNVDSSEINFDSSSCQLRLVYDVTSYVEEHPGGDAILAHARDDSTKGFYGYAFVPNLEF